MRLKVSCSAVELAAPATRAGPVYSPSSHFPSVGQAGFEPAYLPCIRRTPSPAWLLVRGSENQYRTDDLLVMGQALCRLSYLAMGCGTATSGSGAGCRRGPGRPRFQERQLVSVQRPGGVGHRAAPSWPPRSRTARYLLIRQAPSNGWVAASRWRRTRPPDSGAVPSRFKRAPAARQVHHPREESGRLERQRRTTPGRFRGGAYTLAVHSPRAEDGEIESQRLTTPTRVPAAAGGPARFISHRGERSNRSPRPG